MKKKENFILSNIAGEHIMMPVGPTALKFSGLILANDVSAFIWDNIEKADSPEEMAELICGQFEADYDEVQKDVTLLFEEMKKAGWIE